jgi:hypothetical protein
MLTSQVLSAVVAVERSELSKNREISWAEKNSRSNYVPVGRNFSVFCVFGGS